MIRTLLRNCPTICYGADHLSFVYNQMISSLRIHLFQKSSAYHLQTLQMLNNRWVACFQSSGRHFGEPLPASFMSNTIIQAVSLLFLGKQRYLMNISL